MSVGADWVDDAPPNYVSGARKRCAPDADEASARHVRHLSVDTIVTPFPIRFPGLALSPASEEPISMMVVRATMTGRFCCHFAISQHGVC